MNVSASAGPAIFDMPQAQKRTVSSQQGFADRVAQSIDKRQEEKRNREPGGLPFPNQLTGREQREVERLKSQAMEIASQAKEGLSSGQLSQIKAIEQRIRSLGGMPMSESLTESAKQMAEQSKAEQQSLKETEEARMQEQTGAFQVADSGQMPLDDHPGMAMLQQKALVTAIKCLPRSTGAVGSI